MDLKRRRERKMRPLFILHKKAKEALQGRENNARER